MKSLHLTEHGLLSLLAIVALTPAFADEPLQPTPISAEDAFDAVQSQVYPGTDSPATVILVDVRDPQEVLSSGAAAAVGEILLFGEEPIEPELGKVRLTENGQFIEYEEAGGLVVTVPLEDISSLEIEPIAYNIKLWDQTESGFDLKPQALKKTARAFAKDVVALIDKTQADVVIVYCRTGGRSSFAGQFILNGMYTYREDTFWSNRLPLPYSYEIEVYELDDPAGNNGRGGFSGPDYSGVFNGYAGFPGRSTDSQAVLSVSWKDSGLPVKRESKALPE